MPRWRQAAARGRDSLHGSSTRLSRASGHAGRVQSVPDQASILCRTDMQNGERPAMAENNREITADSQVARIFEWRRGFNTIHLIDVGVHLGLFQALVEK